MSFTESHLQSMTSLSFNLRRHYIDNGVLTPDVSPFLKSELCFLNLFPSIKEKTVAVH